MFGIDFGATTSLERVDNTLRVRIWIWKLCIEWIFNVYLDEDRDGVRD